MTRLTSAALAVSLLIPGAAFAQTQPAPSGAAMTGAPTQQQAGEYLADDIVGTRVRNAQDENIGSVTDLVINNDGQVKSVIVSVGGFLGIGDKHVAVPWNQLQVRADASGAGSTGATTGGTAAASRDPVLVVNMTKDQLKAAPEFKTMAQQGRDSDRTGTAPGSAPATAPRTTPAN